MTRPASNSHIAVLDVKACLGCGKCIEMCPMEAIPENLLGLFSHLLKIDEAKCNGCGVCISLCPHQAIKLIELI